MALRKPNTDDQATAAASSTPAFEAEEHGVETTVETPTDTAAAVQQPASAPAPVTALAVKNNTAMAVSLKKNTLLDDLQNVIDSEMLEGMGFGAFPRITVTPGGFAENKAKMLGSKIKLEILSWNFLSMVTTGEQNNKEADKLIRSSYDHVNIPSEGCTIDDYVKRLKADGYSKTSVKKYVEVYANLLWTEKGGDIPAEEVKMVQLSLSPQSVSKWGVYLLESRVKGARGVALSPVVVVGAESKTLNGNMFGVAEFGVKA